MKRILIVALFMSLVSCSDDLRQYEYNGTIMIHDEPYKLTLNFYPYEDGLYLMSISQINQNGERINNVGSSSIVKVEKNDIKIVQSSPIVIMINGGIGWRDEIKFVQHDGRKITIGRFMTDNTDGFFIPFYRANKRILEIY